MAGRLRRHHPRHHDPGGHPARSRRARRSPTAPTPRRPMAGADVGVVVVGETPYAEGFGDVGGPECGFCTPRSWRRSRCRCSRATRRSSTRSAPRSRRASCSSSPAGRRCSPTSSARSTRWSRPWLPGSEGAGVADVLFGQRPFTGRLLDDLAAQRGPGADQRRRRATTTRCSRTAGACAPIPRATGSPRPSRRSARPTGIRRSGRRCKRSTTPSPARNWTGNATSSAALLRPLAAALAALDRAPADTTATQEAIVSVARDLAQARVAAGTADADWARLIANADHALLTGNARRHSPCSPRSSPEPSPRPAATRQSRRAPRRDRARTPERRLRLPRTRARYASGTVELQGPSAMRLQPSRAPRPAWR